MQLVMSIPILQDGCDMTINISVWSVAGARHSLINEYLTEMINKYSLISECMCFIAGYCK